MNQTAKKAYTEAAALFGRMGGESTSERKKAASRKNLKKARKNRWKKAENSR